MPGFVPESFRENYTVLWYVMLKTLFDLNIPVVSESQLIMRIHMYIVGTICIHRRFELIPFIIEYALLVFNVQICKVECYRKLYFPKYDQALTNICFKGGCKRQL